MQILISSDNAKLIAGLYKAASTDAGRPVMQMIKPVFDAGRLTLYVTDSYRAVRRSFPIRERSGDPGKMRLLHAKGLADAIKAAAKLSGQLWIDFEEGIVVTKSADGVATFTHPVMTDDADRFPKGIESFFDENQWDTERLDRSTFWLNPALLRDTIDASGLTKSQQGGAMLRIFHAGTEKSSRDNAPVGFELVDQKNRTVEFHAIQMPVRYQS